jgi:hypothetical protein
MGHSHSGIPIAQDAVMTKPTLLLCSLALSVLVARSASAAVCVSLDASRDNFTEQDRAAAVSLLAQTLQQQGLEVSNQNCLGTYVVSHLRLGNSVTVNMQGPQGYRQATARAIEELPSLYSQMVRSLITGQPMGVGIGTTDRTNATAAQQAPNRVEADSLWYARLGYGAIPSPIFSSGPDVGFGYRYELDNIGIDLSFNLMIPSRGSAASGTSAAGVSGSWIKLEGLYFANPMANSSIYYGGGVSWGAAAIANANSAYSGSGLQAELSVGYEMLRASTIRLFGQINGTLPLYTVTQDAFFDPNTGLISSGSNTGYAPSFSASIGIGWGRSIVRIHAVP